LRTLTGTSVGLCALTTDRKAAAVAKTLVAADLNLAADVCSNLTAKVTFELEIAFKVVTQCDELGVTEVLDADIWGDASGFQSLLSAGTTHTVNVRKRYLNSLVAREVDANKTCHLLWLLYFIRRS